MSQHTVSTMTSTFKRLPLLAAALFSMFVALAAVPAQAQVQEISPEHLDLARRYVNLTDSGGVYEALLVSAGIRTFRTLSAQNPEIGAQLNETVGRIISTYRDKKSDLFDQFARNYALVFSVEELQEIVTFYESPTGTKLAKANIEINETNKRVLQIFTTNLGREFFAAVRADLKAQGIDS
jgi:hypothetical protein